MSIKFELTAEPRTAKGTGASRRLRHAGKVPAVLYGGGKEPVMIAFDHDGMLHHLQDEAFHTSILTINLGGEKDQAILRDCQMHPFKQEIVHIDLQRISTTERLHMRVPLHFVGQDIAPGVKQEGGIVSHLMTEVDIICLPDQLPEYLTVDISQLHIGESVHLSGLPLPEGVAITSLARGGDDLAVAAITAVHVVEEEAPAEAAAEEGEAAEGAEAAPSEGETKETEPAAKKPEQKKEGK